MGAVCCGPRAKAEAPPPIVTGAALDGDGSAATAPAPEPLAPSPEQQAAAARRNQLLAELVASER
jgi:hypothetical protein